MFQFQTLLLKPTKNKAPRVAIRDDVTRKVYDQDNTAPCPHKAALALFMAELYPDCKIVSFKQQNPRQCIGAYDFK